MTITRSGSVVDRRTSRRLSEAILEQHTKIFASMCPDEILDHYDDYQTRMYYTTLMLGDVSGFTDLTEKYTKAGRGGPSKLTETLNSYIGAMVQEILSHNGDVLKFSGDAFIVMWKLQEGRIMRDLAVEAMQTACIIQKHFGTYDTDVGVTLKVKLAIASGKTYFTSIGDPGTMSYYIITGRPVWDVKFAEGLCRGGDILVAPSSWKWVNPNEYVHETLPDGVHTLIIACSSSWYHTRGEPQSDESTVEETEQPHHHQPHHASVSLGSVYSHDLVASATRLNMNLVSLTAGLTREDAFKQVDYSLRPKVIKVAKTHLKDALQSYMLRPVVRSVELDEPLEYLTEMRQVVILFVNCITDTLTKKRLIALVNDAYKLVCRIVGAMQGCVNKTSLFDKDLMFLCIFGLRGDKHELESRIGLRCASRVRQGLAQMKSIKSVTIGVTTGMTYCGVVGHILRREYTVIGMSVNKAARLMCAYTDKVICDRESFLHSRLEAGHFILQEPKALKGITNVGPVYEFREQDKFKVPDLVWSRYPLLGRDAEMNTFRQMLRTLLEYNSIDSSMGVTEPEQNTLIIVGEPRMGKTRLLDEIAQNIPTGVSCNYISLVSSDRKTQYTLIHLMFSMPLGFTLTSSPKDREDKLLRCLGRLRQPEYLCALNQPFNVRFPVTPRYRTLSDVDKRRILRKFLRKLMYGCFQEFWVIVVDDTEYSDEESLQLFDVMAKQNFVLFVFGVGKKLSTDHRLHPTLLTRAHVIELSGIDKWYHAGLVCQILDVSGLPAELEKLIQERSFGNPGWIESYLISLVQAGDLMIVKITRREADLMGYVMPHIIMLKRFVSDSNVMDAHGPVDRTDRWQMYRTSFRVPGSLNSVDVRASFAVDPDLTDDSLIAVCQMSSNFPYEEVDASVTVDSMILKLFDALNPLDQLLLKCSSVLGATVDRFMLESLMESTSKREMALAVRKLFELRIFGCAVGNFPRMHGISLQYRPPRDPMADSEIRCGCTGIDIPDELKDLPKYASCGLMRFKMSLFRETTYGLLTENQKMDLHSKALRYLQQNTKRCVACGETQFTRLLGKTNDQEGQTTYIADPFDIPAFGKLPSVVEIDQQDSKSDSFVTTCLAVCRRLEKKSTGTFSQVDFADCQCNLILMTAYTQILNHCEGIGANDMTMTAILEFVEICLTNYNIPQARRLLADGEALLTDMFDSSEEELLILPYLTSKILALQGRCCIEIGLLAEAEETLLKAIKSLGYHFPRTDIVTQLKTMTQLRLLQLTMLCMPWKIGNLDGLAANYSEQLATCLTQMFNVYRAKGMKKHARLTAVWGLNSALASNKDFFVVCSSYTNMMSIAHMCVSSSMISYLENGCISTCSQKNEGLELEEFKVIAELYSGIFFSRWLRGQVAKAIEIGFITIRMANTIGSALVKLAVLPRIIHLLKVSCRHSEAVSMLRELEFVSQNDVDKSGRTWYFALCIDVLLDTGLMVLSVKKCEQYYLREGDTMINLKDPESQRRYFTSMWLWCIRTNQWEAAKVWSTRCTFGAQMMDEHTVAATLTALKKLEGWLILYVHEMNSKNEKAFETLNRIKRMFKNITRMTKMTQVILPRYIFLKAYYSMIRSRQSTAMKLLRKAEKTAVKLENKMIFSWVQHCRMSWKGSLSTVQQELWKEQLLMDKPWDEVNANDSQMACYTFPLPKYVL